MTVSRNVAIDGVALQSSYSQYSHPNDPLGAISGTKTGGFGFHTELEENPWWMLDLGKTFNVDRVVVYNRCDAAPERARNMVISLCEGTGKPWEQVYRAENEFGGLADSNELRLNFGRNKKFVRYVKIELIGREYLHLDEVEVYGMDGSAPYRALINDVLVRTADSDKVDNAAKSDRSLGAIVVLTRGYSDLAGYDALIARNRSIYEHINSRVTSQYPLLVFHEGDIDHHHQVYIRSVEKNQDLRFVDISSKFRLPADVDTSQFRESWSNGYRLMCRFNALDIWELVKEFEYILRIDEDCILDRIVEDPFLWANHDKIDYGAVIFVEENHQLTRATMPDFVRAFLSCSDLQFEAADIYNDCFPYTNFGLARTEFFLRDDVMQFLRSAVAQPQFYQFRWGDLPLLGCALNLFSTEQRVKIIPDTRYSHESHGHFVTSATSIKASRNSRRDRETQLYGSGSPFFASLSGLLGVADRRAAEVLLLSAAADYPIASLVREALIDVMTSLGRIELVNRLKRVSGSQNKVAEPLGYPVGQSRVLQSHSVDDFYRAYFSCQGPMNVIQVGANDGVMCDPIRPFLAESRMLELNATLVEPIPFYCEKLQALYGDYHNITIVNSACGAEAGILPFYFLAPEVADQMNGEGPANDWAHGQGSFHKDTIVHWINENRFRGAEYIRNIKLFYESILSMDVPIQPLRDIPASRDYENLLVVIDAQGYEMDVIRGIDWSMPPAYIVFEDDLKKSSSLIQSFLIGRGYEYICGDNDKVYGRLRKSLVTHRSPG